jgi:hypothetical protein
MSSAAADQTLPLVRDGVRKVLTRSKSFRALPPDERRRLANDMVKVARYIVDAGGETAGVPVHAQIATGLADPVPLPPHPSAADGFKGNVAKQGSQSFTDTIGKVNFPKFVGGLIEGVFNAIVKSSIKQMEAYSQMVANIAKSADQYMKDNVSENQTRDWLAAKYPEHLQVDTSKGQPALVPRKPERSHGRDRQRGGRGGGTSQSLAAAPFGMEMPDFQKDLGLPAPVKKLDEKTVEQTLVPAARMRMAMDRQQLLATMVLMGINRLIVTDGKISASCLFQLDTREAVYDDKTNATDYDSSYSYNRGRRDDDWFNFNSNANFQVSTTNDSNSEAEATMHAELTGNVDINFRSETFPLEKMADVLQIKEIEQKAPAAATPAMTPAPAAPPVNLPPPPALPNMPGSPFAPAAPAPGSG